MAEARAGSDAALRDEGRRLVAARLAPVLGRRPLVEALARLVEESVYTPLVRLGPELTIDYGGGRREVTAERLAAGQRPQYERLLVGQAERVASLGSTVADDLRLLEAVERAQLTLVSRLRLLALLLACREAVGGAFVECGVARGGCVAVMQAVAAGERPVWGFDSFEGMPELAPEDRGEGLGWVGYRCGPEEGRERVLADLAELVPTTAGLRLVKGWVEETLPEHGDEIGEIAVLRLDVDFFAATRRCLDSLYDVVVPGGVVIIDDYGAFAGCRDAVDAFRAERAITSPLVWEDVDAVHWVVP